MEETFFKLGETTLKRTDDGETLAAYVFDTSINDWRPTSIGALTEASMYGRVIEDPGPPATPKG